MFYLEENISAYIILSVFKLNLLKHATYVFFLFAPLPNQIIYYVIKQSFFIALRIITILVVLWIKNSRSLILDISYLAALNVIAFKK